MSGVYYFDCQIDGGKQLEHSSTDPSNPCPICRISALEKVVRKLVNELEQWSLTENDPESVEAIKAGKDALAA